MKIIAIADTHGFHDRVKIPTVDVLIVAGDICGMGSFDEVGDFGHWLSQQPCNHKIVVAGNHDAPFQQDREKAESLLSTIDQATIHYLQDESITIDGVKFYGSPWTPTFMDWHFMADRGTEIRKKWAMIPDGTDVLITHGPPSTILDSVRGFPEGCDDLLERVLRINPKYHVFGHIHEGYGMTRRKGTTFINACVCDGWYKPINKPVVFDL